MTPFISLRSSTDSIPMALRVFLALFTVYFFITAVGLLLTGRPPVSGFLDELIVLSLLPLCLIPLVRFGLPKQVFKLIAASGAAAAIGFFSIKLNPLLDGYPSTRMALTAIAIEAKVYIMAICTYILVWRSTPKQLEKTVIRLLGVIAIFAVVNGLFGLFDIVRGTDLHGRALTSRAGLQAPHGLFSHKFLFAFISLLGVIAALSLSSRPQSKRFWRSVAMFLSTMCLLSLSVKETLAVFLIYGLYFATNGKTVVRIAMVVVILLISISLLSSDTFVRSAALDRISLFLGPDRVETVRTAMNIQAFAIARDYFPIGSGSGTFGSMPSRDIAYSPLYYEYGIAWIYGGSQDFGDFLLDTYWPKILAEYGVIGTLLYCYLWIEAFRNLSRQPRLTEAPAAVNFARLTLISFLLISLATPVFNYAEGAIAMGLSAAILMRLRHPHSQSNAHSVQSPAKLTA